MSSSLPMPQRSRKTSSEPKNPSPLSRSPDNPNDAPPSYSPRAIPVPHGAGESLEVPLLPKPNSPNGSAASSPGGKATGVLTVGSAESDPGIPLPRLASSSSSPTSNNFANMRHRKRSFTPPHSRSSSPPPPIPTSMSSSALLPTVQPLSAGARLIENSKTQSQPVVPQLGKRDSSASSGVVKLVSGKSSPREGVSPPRVQVIAPGTPLVGDARISHTRLIITKTHTSYPAVSTLIPFPAAILGFHIVFHTPSGYSAQRVHNADMTINFHSPAGLPSTSAPVVKAIYPSRSTFGSPETSVSWKLDSTLGISIGYSPYGALNVGKSSSRTLNTSTSANFVASGLETSSILMTLSEDPVTKNGVPSSFDFACLLYLPASAKQAGEGGKEFTCTLDVDATVGSAWTRLWSGGERSFRLEYDGTTQLGRLEFGGVVQYEGQQNMVEGGDGGTASPGSNAIDDAAWRAQGAIGYEVEHEA